MNREVTVSFTGHRTYDNLCCDELYNLLNKLYKRGYRVFMSGMAMGFDIAAAEAVIRLKRNYLDVELICIIPFKGQNSKFSCDDKRRYNDIISRSDEVIILLENYSAECYMLRNNYLVDNSTVVVTYYDGSRGGTEYTVRRARKKMCEILNVYKSPQLTLF